MAPTTFLGKLRRDKRGNTLATMAAALIPMLGFAGSAVDMARQYVVRVRLQQACDAGVLAGRKFMNNDATLDTNASTQAQAFFTNNFRSGWLGTSAVSFTPKKDSAQLVSGTAAATVPMTIMKIFGVGDTPLTVSCQAELDIADTDVMFVLDTTGSMACLTSDDQGTCDSYVVSNTVQNADGSLSVTEKPSSRIAGLRSAVLSFYDTLTSNTADPNTHFRYGFVPYNATANVGALLQPLGYMNTGNASYQSRVVTADANSGSSSLYKTITSTTKANCDAQTVRSPTTALTYRTDGTATQYTGSFDSSKSTCTVNQQTLIPNWTYKQVSYAVGSYVGGATVDNPAQVTSATSKWNGCVEERAVSSATTFDPLKPPLELDVDSAPTSTDPTSYWNPMWQDVVFARQSSPETSSSARTISTRFQDGNAFGTYEIGAALNELPCPPAAKRLFPQVVQDKATTRKQISDYMLASNGFRPYGVTYHDSGMTWGTRLLSPSGMFASDTGSWTGHNPPNRYIIFLTDGQMETDEYAYTGYGIEQWDNRAGSGTNNSTLATRHNARFAAACQIAKNHNITIFVIGYAQTVTDDMKKCASPNDWFYASDSATLTTKFQDIAKAIAMLRLSK